MAVVIGAVIIAGAAIYLIWRKWSDACAYRKCHTDFAEAKAARGEILEG